jgi:hypothetical protein
MDKAAESTRLPVRHLLLFVRRILMANSAGASKSIVGMTATVCGRILSRWRGLAHLKTGGSDKNITMQMWKWGAVPC